MVVRSKRRERTIAREAEVRGVGFLLGSDVRVRFRPAGPGAGLAFARVDLPGQPRVAAVARNVVPRDRRTAIRDGEAVVEMVEHVLAALAGLRIDNCTIEIDSPETPGFDGSSLAFVEALERAGAVEQPRDREVLVIDRPVLLRDGAASLVAGPADSDDLILSYQLDYGPGTPIGRQARTVALRPGAFRDELANSRTFLLREEAEALRAAGIGTRTTEADLLIFGPDGPIGNALRHSDECVRHKILDMVGDLALAGVDLVGRVSAERTGHRMNVALVRELLRIDGRAEGRAGAA